MEIEAWPVVVIGAGAAGLLAASRAAERGQKVLLCEKNRRPGVKILMSGGTRCNITQATDRRGIINAFGRPGRFLHSALAALSPQDVVALIESEGVATKVEPTGKIFPVSDKAGDVLAALMQRLTRSGATLATGEPVLSCGPLPAGGWQVTTSRRTLHARSLIITSGGQSYPGCGTSGDGYAWARECGHTVIATRPALTPVTTSESWVPPLQGITIPDARIRVWDERLAGGRKAKPLDERRGSILFAHFGMSGPAILDLSRVVSGHAEPGSLVLECDFLPHLTEAAFLDALAHAARREGSRTIATWLSDRLPKRLVAAVLPIQGVDGERRLAELSADWRQRIVTAAKAQPIRVQGTRGFKKAEVTAGGVALDEVDSSTMQSKRFAGLYFAGEILDLDGPIGGYNFQAAFSTGWLAGNSV